MIAMAGDPNQVFYQWFHEVDSKCVLNGARLLLKWLAIWECPVMST
jgi:hypothetical protein